MNIQPATPNNSSYVLIKDFLPNSPEIIPCNRIPWPRPQTVSPALVKLVIAP